MAFGSITKLFLNGSTTATNIGWGTNVFKLCLASDGAGTAVATTNHGTGGAVAITVIPFADSSTSGSQPEFGWAVLPADMGGVAGVRRFFKAGTHSFSCSALSSTAATSADTTFVLRVYRVGVASTFTRTLIGSATSAAYNFGAVPNTYMPVSISVVLAEIILEPGETIQYSVEVNAPGAAVTSRRTGLRFGTAADTITFPQLGGLADTTGTATGLGDAPGVTGKVLSTSGTATGLGNATGVLASINTTTGTGTGLGTTAGFVSAVAGTVGIATGIGVASGITGKVMGAVGTVEIGGGAAIVVNTFRPILLFED